MTAKRFTFHHDVDGVDYIEDESNGFCLICDKLMCSLLNELHEENQLLKLQVETKLFSRRELEKENEQLKKEIKAKDKIIELYYEMVKE